MDTNTNRLNPQKEGSQTLLMNLTASSISSEQSKGQFEVRTPAIILEANTYCKIEIF